jgi:hypothetical protein
MKTASMKITGIEPAFNRCLTFHTNHGTITCKVQGADEQIAQGVRNALVGALAHLPGVTAIPPAGTTPDVHIKRARKRGSR